MSGKNDKRPGPISSAALQLLVFVVLLCGTAVLYYRSDRQDPESASALNAIDRMSNVQQADQSEPASPSTFNGDALQISPDGTQLAFLRGARFHRDIWISPRDAIENAAPLGLAVDQGVLQFEWALDNAHIIFRRPFDVLNQVYAAEITTGQTIALNSFEGSIAGDLSLSPRHPDEALMRLGDTPEADPDLYLVNLASGEMRLVEPAGTVGEFYADEDFVVRAGRTLDTRGFTIFARRDAGWEQVRFVAREPGEQAGVLYLGATRNRIYILDDEGRNTIGLSSIDLTTGERNVIAAPEDGDIVQVLRDPATSDIFAYAVAEDETIEWRALDADNAGDMDRLNALPGGDARVLSQSLNNDVWTIEAENNFYIFDRNSGTLSQIRS